MSLARFYVVPFCVPYQYRSFIGFPLSSPFRAYVFFLGVMYVHKTNAVKVASSEVYSSHDVLDVVYTFRQEGGGDVHYQSCEVTA